ncbi:hypothetical protein CDAR_246031 [Caerostris darwini]|uniref:Endonuclease/exonuclease/phosphatase domain-containing protein n=1 Tax=Caerostris darwini TaxID=1538125 RepID=A0AAV4TK39_9ARAC|nr:hypothetical protein CDAR_246031 [Caerostris darwini]
MDNMLEELLPPADLLKGISYNADDVLKVALGYYKNILYLADKKDIRTDSRAAFRDNAMGLLSLLQSQTIKMAQLQDRLTELEKSKDAEESTILALVEGRMTDMERNLNDRLRTVQQLPPQNFPTFDKPSFSVIVKATPAINNQPKKAPKPRKQHLAIIKPKDDSANSTDTKNFIQRSVGINKVKIGVKKVTNVKKGGMLIETDLDKLIRELDSNPAIKDKFDVGKPLQRNPQIICYGVSNETTEDTVTNCIKLHCSLDESSTDIKMLHSFKGARGRNWNFESTPEAFLNNSFAEHDYDFFSLNEPYFFQDQITNIPNSYKIAAFHSSPKAAIAIKAAYNSQSILISREVVVILAKIHNTDFLLTSIYCPPSNNIEVNLHSLTPFLNKYSDTPMIILGDFNAKSRVWGQRNLDERGSKLLMFCNQQDLNIENSPDSPPTFTSTRGESWIDLLLTKNITADISLEILDEVTNSDHNLLVLKYPLTQIAPRKINRIYLKASNWLAIKTAISGIIHPNLDIDHLTDNEIKSHIKTIQNKIFEASNTSHIPRANPNQRKKKKRAV